MLLHKVIYLSILYLAGVSANNNSDSNIPNHPYIVLLRVKNPGEVYTFYGSVFAPKFIITNANCVFNKPISDIEIYTAAASTEEGIPKFPSEVYIHPKYKSDGLDYDIAILKLDEDLIFNEYVQPIALAKERPKFLTNATIPHIPYAGDSFEIHHQIEDLHARILVDIICSSQYYGSYTKNMLCVGEANLKPRKDDCKKNYGLPLICKNQLLGIILFGNGGCPSFPEVYISIPDMKDWIQSVTK